MKTIVRDESNRALVGLMTLLVFLLGVMAAPTAAQRQKRDGVRAVKPRKVVAEIPIEEREFKNYAVSESRYVEELFTNAQRMLKNRDWVGGVSHLQEIMDRYGNKVHRRDPGEGVYRSYRERCLEQLRTLPPEGIAAYRTQFDRQAKELLARGRSQRDTASLRELVRRFSLTSTAPEALKNLGKIHMERGDLEEALYHFDRLRAEHDGGAVDTPGVLLDSGFCARQLGRIDILHDLAKTARADHPGARVRYQGETADLVGRLEQWIRDVRSDSENRESYSWKMIGGNPGRNRLLARPRSDSPLQWTFPLPQIEYGRTQNRSYQNYREVTHHRETVYPVHPVVGPDSVIIHNGYEVQSLDLYVGRVKWTFTSPDEDDLAERTDTRQIFSGVLDNDTYFVNLETAPEESSWDWLHGPVLVPIPMRKLFALDAETGDERWSHRHYVGKNREETRFMQKLSISSPPLVARNTVYAIGSLFEGKIHCYACAFDAQTGDLLWRTLICTGQQELNMFGRPLLEHVASTLAEKDGNLYFSTNLGLAASVDARLGSIRWITEYDSIEMPLNQGFHFMVRKFSFHNCPPIVAGDAVILAPLDSETVYCLEGESGETRWKIESRDVRGGINTLLGVKDDLVLLGGGSVTAIDLDTGASVWGFALGPRNKAAGLGGVTEDLVLCPTKDNLSALHLETGRTLFEDLPLGHLGSGNLIVTDRFLIQAGARTMSVCYRWSEVFQALKDRVAAHPEDPLVFLEVGNIYRQGKEFIEASNNYKTAIRLARQDPVAPEVIARATAGLYAAYMALGESAWKTRNLPDALKWYELALEEAYDTRTKLECYLAFVRYYQVRGDSRNLIASYETILRELPRYRYAFGGENDPLLAGLYSLLSLAEHYLLIGQPEKAVATFQRIIRDFPDEVYQDGSAHNFASSKIDELMKHTGPTVYSAFEEQARELFAKARQTDDVDNLRAIVQEYPNSSVVQPALVLLAELLMKNEDFSEAVSVLRRFLIAFPGSDLGSHVLEKLGESYLQAGYPAAAQGATRRLDYDRVDFAASHKPLARLVVPPTSLWKKSYSRSIGLHLMRITDRSVVPVQDRFFFQSNRVLSCADVKSGEVKWQNDLGERLTPQATLIDGLLFVSSSRAVIAVSAETGEEAWEARPTGLIRDTNVVPGTVLLVVENRDQAGLYSIQARESVTGKLLWERNFKGRLYGQLILTESFVSAYSTKPVSMISIDPFDNRKQFEYEIGPHYMHPTALGENRVFIYKQNELRVLDLERKTIAWEDLGNNPKTSVKGSIGFGDRIAILTAERNSDFEISMRESATGNKVWNTALPSGYILPARPLAHEGGSLIFLNRRNPDLNYCLLAVSVADGSIAWETEPYEGRNLPRQVLETESHVVVERNYLDDTELKNVVLVCDKETGEVEWDWVHRGNYTSEVAIVGDTLLIALANQVEAYGGF